MLFGFTQVSIKDKKGVRKMYTVRLKGGTQFTCKYYEQVSGVYYFYQTSRGVTITSLASEIDYIY